ncbi:MAG: hypothetical protein ACP5QO_08960 [Clostridia bacterium]
MRDLTTMLWKETRELIALRRSLLIFLMAVLLFGVLPAVVLRHGTHSRVLTGSMLDWFRFAYGLFAALFIALQTAPDLVLHERVGRTLDYLLTTRLPDGAIYGGKILTSAIFSYVAGWLALGMQLFASALLDGNGWHWLYLANPGTRTAALFIMAGLSVYVSVVGTFVAFRVGDQRTAYMVSLVGVVILIIPLALQWIPISFTNSWLMHASLIFDLFAAAVGVAGLLLFRRQMLVLYLQE